MVKIHLLTIFLIATLSVVAKAEKEKEDNRPPHQPSSLILSPHTDTDHTIHALFSDLTAMAGGDLWDRIRSGFEMPDLDMAQVAEQERYYAKHPEYINRIVSRGSRYLYHIVSEVQKRGMPMELALLPIVESAYNPRAESHARASGIWQFIPSTGKMYGLERTWWYDGRRDVVAATNAALNYLQRLYDIFGDWPLALAAYNWGDGSVKRAQAKNIARGMSTEYTAINMPAETRNYVPKLLAIRNIIANPLAYGIKLAMIPDKPYFTTLKPQRHIDVKVAAKLAEISVEELLNLNPGYIRPVIAHKENRQLVLPIEKAEIFKKNLAKYAQPLLNWQPYTTKRGETFSQIATKYGVTLEELRRVNSLAANITTARGQTLLVPIKRMLDDEDKITLIAIAANQKGNLINKDAPEAADVVALTARPLIVPKNTPVTPPNPLSSRPLPPAAKSLNPNVNPALTNQPPVAEALQDFRLFKNDALAAKVSTSENLSAESKAQHYEVKRGDTLYSIAKRYQLSPEELARINRITNNQLHPGQVLIISTTLP
jgi:membrane-bound lytic murein transglycosylase D